MAKGVTKVVRRVRVVLLTGTAILGAAAMPATAQEAAPADTTAQSDNAIGDIVVTARRREENLQTVPIAITALSQQTLQANNVVQIGDVQTLVPSVAITSANVGQRESANFSIRGQGYGSIAGQPAVALYINEVPIVTDFDGALAGGPGLLFDLENVQVLKGPQGTLFGRNTMGGAVLLQTARPREEFGGRFQAGIGNYDNRELQGAVNLPLVPEKLLARIAFSAQKRDGFTRVQSMPGFPNGLDLDNRDFYAVRGSLTFKPSDNFQNDLVVTYQKYKSHGTSNILVDLDPNGPIAATYPNALSVLALQNRLGPRVRVPNSVNTDGTNGSLFAIQNITRLDLTDDISLRNIFGFQKAIFDYRADVDGTPFQVFDVAPNRYPAQQISNELQLVGKSLGGKLDWIVGGFYSDQGPPDRDFVPTLGISVLQPIGTPPDKPNVLIQRQLLLESKAVFAQATYELVDGLRATVGGRYTWDERQDGSISNGALVRSKSDSEAFTYTLGLDYQVTPRTLLYVASRRGYRAGGQTTASNGARFRFDPEYVTDYELGIKSDFSLGTATLRTNANVYMQDYSDIQVNQLIPRGGTIQGVAVTDVAGINLTTNAGAARLWGAEFEGTLVLSDYVQLGANFSYLDFDYKAFAPGVNGAALEATKSANRIPFTYGFNGTFALPTSEQVGKIALRANYHWQDDFGDFLGTSTIPSYGLLNLALDWTGIGGSSFDGQLFVSNATNKTYQNGGIGFLGFTERTFGEPRMYGLRLTYRFGAEGR